MNHLIVKLITRLKGSVRKLIALRATPNQIATGFAVGIFIGIFPTFGLGALLIMALAPMWKFNIPASIAGTLIGNPLLAPIWIFLSCLVVKINPSDIKVPEETFVNMLVHYSQIGLWYLLGNTAVSLVVAVISYFCVIGILTEYQKRKKNIADSTPPASQ